MAAAEMMVVACFLLNNGCIQTIELKVASLADSFVHSLVVAGQGEQFDACCFE
jgi:hypothetical protein